MLDQAAIGARTAKGSAMDTVRRFNARAMDWPSARRVHCVQDA
jgi:hypothetical protein